jgi:glycosyltransferase involved in cell wall biosynthesis
MNAKVIHWPVNLPKLTDRDDAGGAIRADLGISASDRVLLFLGRLHPSKRPLETIQALKLSGAANVHLIIVGMDDLITAESCCRLAADLGLARVHAVGPMFGERKLEYFAAADGFISLSLKDNFSYSVAEALASGTAVILSPGIDLVSELKGTQCGWLLDSFALEAAAAAIREFSRRDTSELQTVGSCGREWARRVLDPGIFDSKLRRLYAQTVAGSHSIRSVDATSPRQNGL